MSAARGRLLTGLNHVAALNDLTHRRINYSPDEVGFTDWNIDLHRYSVGSEEPGPVEPGGTWRTACRLVRDYEFSPPDLVRAIYDPNAALLGRNMLLEARFHGIRFHIGVRITTVTDESDDDHAQWGWAYETLDGHLERGRVHYSVIKHLASGNVEFVVTCQSQPAPTLGPLLRAGWNLFGRRTQLRFYRECGDRLARLVRDSRDGHPPGPATEADGLVVAPSGAAPGRGDLFSTRYRSPGTR